MPVDRDSVMAQIDTRFEKDYRVGWPKNSLLSWPEKTKFIEDDDQIKELRSLMYQTRFFHHVRYEVRHHDNAHWESFPKTLVVEAAPQLDYAVGMAPAPDMEKWKELLILIRERLHAKGNHCPIDMFYRPNFYLQPIHFEEKTVLEAWKAQYLLFLDILRDENFTSLELFRMSILSPNIDPATTKPRVLVCSPMVDTSQWEAVRTKLQAKLLAEFDLEFFYSQPLQHCLSHTRNQADVTLDLHDPYSRTVKMGA